MSETGGSTSKAATASSETGSTSINAFPEMTAEQEFFLYELETTDSSSVGLVLRAIYDTGDVHNFARALERRIANYDRNILRVCTHHYQGFLDSLGQLTALSDKCGEIRRAVVDVDENVERDGAELQSISAEVVRYRKMQRNANLAIDQISMCLPALENYVKLGELRTQKKYLQALKVLEELEHNYFPHLPKYRFLQSLAEGVRDVRKEIRESSYDELKDFLANLQKVCGSVGADAARHVARQHKATEAASAAGSSGGAARHHKHSDVTTTSATGAAAAANIHLDAHGALVASPPSTAAAGGAGGSNHALDEDDEERISARDQIDLSPVHRCCQVFSVLGERDHFERFYRDERRKQCGVLSETPVKVAQSIDTYVAYLNAVMGFFVVEDRISQVQPTLVTAVHKEQLWNEALKNVRAALNSHFGNCLNVELMMLMKRVIIYFILTMKSYGFEIAPLYSLLQNFSGQYFEILGKLYCDEFEKALRTDNYTPLAIQNPVDAKNYLRDFPLNRRGQDQEPYPRHYAFSAFVPRVYDQARKYLHSCLVFMENLKLSQSEVEDTMRRYANVLLTRWASTLQDFLEDEARSLEELVQSTINIGYLEKSCDSLQRYIAKLTSHDAAMDGGVGSGHLIALECQVFQNVRSEAEQCIENALNKRVDRIIKLSNYDWELPQATGRASEYITDLTTYLDSTFKSFANLPLMLARHICIQVCKHLAACLHTMLLNTELSAVSKGALEQFSLDLMQCEAFASQNIIKGYDESALRMTFEHLRQLLDLVICEDWTTYLNQRGEANSRYNRVRTADAALLLEKLIEFERKNSNFLRMGRNQDKKRLYDTILRQLRALAN